MRFHPGNPRALFKATAFSLNISLFCPTISSKVYFALSGDLDDDLDLLFVYS